MASDDTRAKFIHVFDLLTQVAQGIGKGNHALIETSQTSFGTLAVKTADVTIDFVLSSSAETAGLGSIGTGANTLFGVGITKDMETSHATIALKIVPIATNLEPGATIGGVHDPLGGMRPAPDQPIPRQPVPGGLHPASGSIGTVSGSPVSGETPSNPDEVSLMSSLASEFARLVEKMERHPKKDQSSMLLELAEINALILQGDLREAAAKFKDIKVRYPGV